MAVSFRDIYSHHSGRVVIADWKAPSLIALFHRKMFMRLEIIATRLEDKIVMELSKRKYYPKKIPSAPGEVPKIRSGWLRENVTHKTHSSGLVTRVMSRAKYAGFLEFGTTVMEERPYMRPVFYMSLSMIRKILTAPIFGRI